MKEKREDVIKEIQEFLLLGFSASDLMDPRIFLNPYNSQDIFQAILNLKKLEQEVLRYKSTQNKGLFC